MADERDGIFDTGTFDNARFDSVYATSNASIFSASSIVLSLNRSVSSYGNVFSSMDRVIALDRFAESHVGTVFSDIGSLVRRFSVSTSSFLSAYSNNKRVFAFDRAASSFANVYSSNSRVASYARQVSSFAAAYSSNSKVVTYYRQASSHLSMFSVNSLSVRLKPSSYVSKFTSAARALTSAPEFDGDPKMVLESSRNYLRMVSSRVRLYLDK